MKVMDRKEFLHNRFVSVGVVGRRLWRDRLPRLPKTLPNPAPFSLPAPTG